MPETGRYLQTLNLALRLFGRKTLLPLAASKEAIVDSGPSSQLEETGRNKTITD